MSTVQAGNGHDRNSTVCIVGGGPAGLVGALALARRGLQVTVLERDAHPDVAPRFDPDRSYTIDITGHGLRALRHVDATAAFDERMIRFRGIQYRGRTVDEWTEPGWTGSRGDIVRALMAVLAGLPQDAVACEFDSRVEAVDVRTGAVTSARADGRTTTRTFDLVVGADGAGSLVRRSLEAQVPDFTVENRSIPNHITMLQLDRVGDRLDPHYLQALSLRHFTVAGAVNGEDGPGTQRWFCAVGSKEPLELGTTERAREYFRETCPEALDLTGDEELAAFARRRSSHIGRSATCSRLDGGRAVLLGDAAAPFPPIGQGVNAAMESATVLDRCVAENPTDLPAAAASYSAAWKPEADAVTWIAERVLFEEPLNILRSVVTTLLGVNVVGRAKRVDMSYADVRARAERLGPVWA